MHPEWPLQLAFRCLYPPQVRQKVQPSPLEVQPWMVPVLGPLATALQSLLATERVMVQEQVMVQESHWMLLPASVLLAWGQ